MALIRVTAAQLKSGAEELAGFNNQLKNQVNELELCEQNLCTMWEGQAKEAFHRAFCSDRTQMDNFRLLIEQYVEALLSIALKYEQAEAMNTETASTRNY